MINIEAFMLTRSYLILLSLFFLTSTSAKASDITPDTGTFYLRENACWGVYTYIDVMNADQVGTGYFKNSLSSWNNDLYLYSIDGRLMLRTDIKSVGKSRKQVLIFDEHDRLIARVEQDLYNKIGNQLVKIALGKNPRDMASIYRRYTIFDGYGRLVGVSTKNELYDTEIDFWNPSETVLFARATKEAGAKAGAFLCFNPVWKVDLINPTKDQTPASDARIIATVVAIKATVDIDAAAQKRWEAIINVGIGVAAALTKDQMHDNELDGYEKAQKTRQ